MFLINKTHDVIINVTLRCSQVQSCHGATIRLSASISVQFATMYEIILQNTANVTQITKTLNGDVIASVTNADVLNCNEMRFFWVKWGDILQVGQGHVVGENLLLHVADNDSVPVNFVKLGSHQFDYPAQWMISQEFGKSG